MWNNSYKTPTERWQKTSDLPKGKKLPTYLGWEEMSKRENQGQERLRKKHRGREMFCLVFEIRRKTRLRHPKGDVGSEGG